MMKIACGARDCRFSGPRLRIASSRVCADCKFKCHRDGAITGNFCTSASLKPSFENLFLTAFKNLCWKLLTNF